MRIGDGSHRMSRGSFIGILFLVSVMLAGLGLWLLRFLSLLPLLPLVTRLLPGLTARPLLLTLLVALLVLHRVVAGLLPLVLLLFFIGIHVGHAVYLLKKGSQGNLCRRSAKPNLKICATEASNLSDKNKHSVDMRSTTGTAVP
jgi:hypothetical protein